MNIKINRNIIWAEAFIRNVAAGGVKFACISPGSRSTPLTYAAAVSKEITSYIHIDERSGGFFASGLSRKTNSPVLLICTSGTAAAEYYPAVIEAYQQRIPLIVCTADRPVGSFSKGVNQTINQENLYKNHIRWYANPGLPDPLNLSLIKEIAFNAVKNCLKLKGPVHINFPFDKPFEPDNFTDEIESEELLHPEIFKIKSHEPELNQSTLSSLASEIMSIPEGLITVGPSDFNSAQISSIIRLSNLTGYPVYADGSSQLRFSKEQSSSIMTNYDALFRSGFFNRNKPGLILHFGRTMTSKGYEEFASGFKGLKHIINRFGDLFDPAGLADSVLAADESSFCNKLSDYLTANSFKRKSSAWLKMLLEKENQICELKNSIISKSEFPNESRIITELYRLIPENCSVVLSNSMPVRDFDYFAGRLPKNIRMFHNRGASGIDGMNSTALGIAASGQKTILITGDLAFYHDLNGLITSKQYSIPLLVILINNNGGGIFRALPVSTYEDIFEKYFITPHNLDFRKFVEGYEGKYYLITGWNELVNVFTDSLRTRDLTVLEIKTDAEKSIQTRKKFWDAVEKEVK